MDGLSGNIFDSPFYQLLGGVLADLGYTGSDSIAEFMRNEFNLPAFPEAYWNTLYPPEPESNQSGIYTQVIGQRQVPVMAKYVSRNAEGDLITGGSVAVDRKSIPNSAISITYDEKAFRDAEYLLSHSGIPNAATVLSSFTKGTADLITGIHLLRTHTGLKIESTGKFISSELTGNVSLELDFIPSDYASNTRLAGHFGYAGGRFGKAHDWSNANSDPIGDLKDMVWTYENELYLDSSKAIFRFSRNDWNKFINNAKVIDYMRAFKSSYYSTSDTVYITENDVNAFLTSLQLPTISVERWQGAFEGLLDPDTKKIIRSPKESFVSGKILLRPAGPIGTLQWQAPTQMFATSINPMFIVDEGRIGIQQDTNHLGKSLYYNANSVSIPVPQNVDRWLYCDIKTNQETT